MRAVGKSSGDVSDLLLLSWPPMANTRGVQRCREVIHSGQALDKLHHWVSVQGGKNGEGPRRLETLVRQA